MNTTNICNVGQEDYDRIRPLSYTNAHVFIVCFSILSRSSLANAEERWIPELRKYAKGVPFLLVGTQSDRRDGAPADRVVSQEMGKAAARRLGAVEYVECSAKSRDGLREVFVKAIMTAINSVPADAKKAAKKANVSYKKKSSCSIG